LSPRTVIGQRSSRLARGRLLRVSLRCPIFRHVGRVRVIATPAANQTDQDARERQCPSHRRNLLVRLPRVESNVRFRRSVRHLSS
jgi:hypothetical protein